MLGFDRIWRWMLPGPVLIASPFSGNLLLTSCFVVEALWLLLKTGVVMGLAGRLRTWPIWPNLKLQALVFQAWVQRLLLKFPKHSMTLLSLHFSMLTISMTKMMTHSLHLPQQNYYSPQKSSLPLLSQSIVFSFSFSSLSSWLVLPAAAPTTQTTNHPATPSQPTSPAHYVSTLRKSGQPLCVFAPSDPN